MEELMNQGRRDLLCGEISKAVDSFQKVVENISKEHGEMDDSLADPYFYYGSALLEVARMESGVLGNALEGVPEDDDEEKDSGDLIEKETSLTEEEKEKLSDEVIDAMCEKEESGESTSEESSKEKSTDQVKQQSEQEKDTNESKSVTIETAEDCTDKKEDSTEKDMDKVKEDSVEKDMDKEKEDSAEKDLDKEKEESGPENGEEDDEEAEDAEEEEDANEDDETEDVGNLQLAWEVIELSKKIYAQRGEENEHQLRVADCMFKLGEIGLEKEDYEQAISDIKGSLEIRKKILHEDDRSLAETFYQLAVAFGANNKFDDSVVEFKNCELVLKRRVDTLNQKKTVKDLEASALTIIENEYNQLSDLLPEVRQRIVEAEEEKLDHDHIKKVVREGFIGALKNSETEGFPTTADSSADDISHLVRKKRKADETDKTTNGVSTNGVNGDHASDDVPVKKAKTVENGDSETSSIAEIKTKALQEVTASGDSAQMEEA